MCVCTKQPLNKDRFRIVLCVCVCTKQLLNVCVYVCVQNNLSIKAASSPTVCVCTKQLFNKGCFHPYCTVCVQNNLSIKATAMLPNHILEFRCHYKCYTLPVCVYCGTFVASWHVSSAVTTSENVICTAFETVETCSTFTVHTMQLLTRGHAAASGL